MGFGSVFFRKKWVMYKILLAKRGDIVYKYSTRLFFICIMKRILLPIAVAAICGLPQASAVSADYAQAEQKMKPSDLKVEQVVPQAEYFATKDTAKNAGAAWHYVRIPYELQGKCRESGKNPLFVDELKVHAYLVFSVDGGEKLTMLDKEITYVNIPVTPKGDTSVNSNVQAAVFLSPADAALISGANGRGDLGGKLAAVAVEFQFKGADCSKPGTDADVLVDKKMKNRLKKGWWKKEDKNGVGAKLRAISETPFAPFYAPAFPATSPMYGSESGSSYTPVSAGGYTPSVSTATTDAAAETPAGETDDAAASTKKGKKRRK